MTLVKKFLQKVLSKVRPSRRLNIVHRLKKKKCLVLTTSLPHLKIGFIIAPFNNVSDHAGFRQSLPCGKMILYYIWSDVMLLVPRKHIRQWIKPVQFPRSPYTSALPKDIRRHFNCHEINSNKFFCVVCGEDFTRKDNLLKHWRSQHLLKMHE